MFVCYEVEYFLNHLVVCFFGDYFSQENVNGLNTEQFQMGIFFGLRLFLNFLMNYWWKEILFPFPPSWS